MTENNPSVVYPDTTNNYKIDAVYHHANDKFISAVKMHLSDSKLYFDAEHTKEVPHDVAADFAAKGIIHVVDADTCYPMTSYKDADGTLTLGYGASKTVTVSNSPSL